MEEQSLGYLAGLALTAVAVAAQRRIELREMVRSKSD